MVILRAAPIRQILQADSLSSGKMIGIHENSNSDTCQSCERQSQHPEQTPFSTSKGVAFLFACTRNKAINVKEITG